MAFSIGMSDKREQPVEKDEPHHFTFRVSPSPEALAEAEQLLNTARKNTVSKEAAIKFLASTGMYTPEGALIPVEER